MEQHISIPLQFIRRKFSITCRSAHLKAMEVAKDAGALLSYDPNLRLPLWPSPEEAREQIMSIWDKDDIIKVSDNELEFLTGSDKVDDESTMSLWHPNLKLLLVTLGDKGCNYYTKHFHGTVGAFAVKVVDTTGAGDSFVGALLRKIVDDQSVLEEALRALWKAAFPEEELRDLISEQWKEMGWQGKDPSTDFRIR